MTQSVREREAIAKAIKNWCLLHSAYIFTDEKIGELAEAISLALSTNKSPDLSLAVEALKPFSELARAYPEKADEDHILIKVKWSRRAREAYEQITKG